MLESRRGNAVDTSIDASLKLCCLCSRVMEYLKDVWTSLWSDRVRVPLSRFISASVSKFSITSEKLDIVVNH
jgi:hypothetical protein